MNLAELITEQQNRSSIDIDLKSIHEIIDIFQKEDLRAIGAVYAESNAIAEVIEKISGAFRSGGKLFYIGAGTSGRLGVLDASECPPTFSTPPEMVQGVIAGGDLALRNSIESAEDQPESGADAIRTHGVSDRDVVVGIAASGRTPFVIGALREAKSISAKTVLICCTPPAEDLKNFVDHFIVPIVGPEIIAGSTRMKSGTATKLVLNLISTISMIKIGKVHGNLMVDLNASNEKIRDRAIRILRQVTDCDRTTAERTLENADQNAKVAIVMIKKNLDREKAIEILEKNGGFLRSVLES